MTIRDRITDAAIAEKSQNATGIAGGGARYSGAANTNPASPNVAGKNAGSVFETASGFDSSTASGDSTDSVFYLTYAVYIEGVEVPCSGVAIGYGVQGIPTCAVTLPASALLRDLPQTAKVAVFFKDLVPNNDGVYEWRLLFDGEFMGFGYNVDAKGASMTLNFMHNAAHMHSMQLMTMDMTEFWLNRGNEGSAGGAVVIAPLGYNKPTKTILENLLKEENASNFKSMADIVYTLVRSTLSDVKGSPTGKYFKQKFGDTVVNNDGGYKLLRRFFGISDGAKNMDIPELSNVDPDTYYSNSSGGSSVGGDKMNPDQPRIENQPAAPKPNSYVPEKASVITDRANNLADSNRSFGKEGCARAANYIITGDESYPYSQAADVMATRVLNEGGSLFTDSSKLLPGDIVFYQNTYGPWEKGTVTHVAIYTGDNTVVHQQTGGGGVVKTQLDMSNVAYFGRSYAKVK